MSANVLNRWQQHINNALSNQKSHLYNAMRKYGIENFSFQVIEETDDESREIYWIEVFDSIKSGYNIRSGGNIMKYENSPRHKLSLEEVKDIRTRYARGERKKNVYSLYRDKISFSGFEKVWLNVRWVGIMPEVYKVKK